jgi:hypothetical protein
MRIPNIAEIAAAWYRAANPTEEQALEAARRIAICDACEMKKFIPLSRMHICSACGCPISKKVFSPNIHSCPLGKWEEEDE